MRDLIGPERSSFFPESHAQRAKKNCQKKKIEKGREIGEGKRTSALVPRGLAARPSRVLWIYCD